MVGDDHINIARFRIVDRGVRPNAGVAGEQQIHTLIQDALQGGKLDAVTLRGA